MIEISKIEMRVKYDVDEEYENRSIRVIKRCEESSGWRKESSLPQSLYERKTKKKRNTHYPAILFIAEHANANY